MDEYLQMLMAPNPDDLTAEQQRMMAQRLRGMQTIGALGSTSQVTGARDAGANAMAQAQKIGQAMGDRQETAQGREALLVRALASRGGGGGSRSVNDLTASERKEMKDLAGLLGQLNALNANFRDDFANKDGLGLTQAFVQKGMTNEPVLTKALLKMAPKWTGLQEAERTGQELEQEQEWWRCTSVLTRSQSGR
jgi:hypothetical protein